MRGNLQQWNRHRRYALHGFIRPFGLSMRRDRDGRTPLIDEHEFAMTRDIALALLQAHGNLIGTVLSMVAELDLPAEAVREFLTRHDEANEATIAESPAKHILAQQLATLQELHLPSGS